MSMTPLVPVRSISLPMCDHVSYQNDVDLPFLTSTLCIVFAVSLYLSNFFHIQEPVLELSFTDQKDPFRMRYFHIQVTHIEIIHQISFRQLTLFASSRDFIPSPPSCLGLQIFVQAIFAFLVLSLGPDHKKAEHSFSISFKQPAGSL